MAGRYEKRGKNSYRLIAYSGYDANGKQVVHRKTVTAKNDREADKLLSEFVTNVERGLFTEQKNLALKAFIDIWLRDHAEKQLAPKTIYRYKQILNSRVIPALGHIKLDKIRPNHLLSFYNNLAEPGIRQDRKEDRCLSERSILHHHRIIHSILQTAVEWQYLLSNPAARVKSPKVPKKPATAYDTEQTAELLTAIQSEHIKYQVIILLALSTGMRQGEIMGLEWKHVDFDKQTISVQQCAQYLPGKGIFLKDPKNETSKRLISVPASVMELLKKFKREQTAERLRIGDKWQASDSLFTTWNGRPMYPNQMSSWFPRFLKRHKLPHLNFHGLRHTSATLLIAEGATATDLSRRLGHSNTSTTMNIYAHSLQKADTALAAKMDNILGAHKKGQAN